MTQYNSSGLWSPLLFIFILFFSVSISQSNRVRMIYNVTQTESWRGKDRRTDVSWVQQRKKRLQREGEKFSPCFGSHWLFGKEQRGKNREQVMNLHIKTVVCVCVCVCYFSLLLAIENTLKNLPLCSILHQLFFTLNVTYLRCKWIWRITSNRLVHAQISVVAECKTAGLKTNAKNCSSSNGHLRLPPHIKSLTGQK